MYLCITELTIPIWTSGGVDKGVSWCSGSGLLSWLCSKLQDSEVIGYFCTLAGVLGGVGMAQTSSGGGTEKTTGLEPQVSLLISSTWMGVEWLRKFTWYLFWPFRDWDNTHKATNRKDKLVQICFLTMWLPEPLYLPWLRGKKLHILHINLFITE